MESFVVEKQQQQEQHHSLQLRVSIKQEATEQQLAVYQQRVELLEKLLDKLVEGTALSTFNNTYQSQQKQKVVASTFFICFLHRKYTYCHISVYRIYMWMSNWKLIWNNSTIWEIMF